MTFTHFVGPPTIKPTTFNNSVLHKNCVFVICLKWKLKRELRKRNIHKQTARVHRSRPVTQNVYSCVSSASLVASFASILQSPPQISDPIRYSRRLAGDIRHVTERHVTARDDVDRRRHQTSHHLMSPSERASERASR